MQTPRFVRPLTDAARDTLTRGVRSAAAFTLRRCQIVLASGRSECTSCIARHWGCSAQGARNAIAAFNRDGLAALARRSSRPKTTRPAFDAAGAAGTKPASSATERLKARATRGRRATPAGALLTPHALKSYVDGHYRAH